MESPLKQKNPAFVRWVTLVTLLVLSCVMMVVYANEGEEGPLHAVQRTTSLVSTPAQYVGSAAGAGLDSLDDGLANATANPETLTGLQETNAQLRKLLAEGDEYKKQAEELQALLDLKDSYAAEGVAARVIGKSGNAWDQTITIDKGSNDGVETGLSVMGPYGLIGQTVSVTPRTATVRLLTDPQSGAAAMVQSTREEGIVKGSLEGFLYLENLDENAAIGEGDVIITSGLGGSYVRGLLIGMVVKVDETQGSSSRLVVVAPNDSASSLETVLVVFDVSSSYSGFNSTGSSSDEDAEAKAAEQTEAEEAAKAAQEAQSESGISYSVG